MSATTDFYLARAAENAQAAKDTNLVNVRERCLRAESVWRRMADQLIAVELRKSQAALSKAAVGNGNTSEVSWPITPLVHLKRPKN